MKLSASNHTRVFFRRKVLAHLRSYWLSRWDNLELRKLLSLSYIPKYYIEAEVLDGFYVKVTGFEYVWYKGVFSKGIHLNSGKYYQEPFHYSNKGMGPRELVFPAKILNQLNELTLVGDWPRYQLCMRSYDSRFELVKPNSKTNERIRMAVKSVTFGKFYPTLTRWSCGENLSTETVCIAGTVLNESHKNRKITVPMREIHWNSLK